MSDHVEEKDPKDIIKILVASDVHLGFAEKDAIRENDSYIAFEEVLANAVRKDVDLILLGGDLFHEAKPSSYCINRCMQIIKRYCFGNKAIQIEFLSDACKNLENAGYVNYQDPNVNISFPIFSIHGNHDDPIGSKQVSALDLLSSTGLVNYFGKWTDLLKIEITPLLIRKGKTNLALYGLSHIHDQRLSRLFHENRVTFIKPAGEDWIHILVLHQNRANRGSKNFIPIQCLPNFLHLIIWGHEHDCFIQPQEETNFFVSQPGSTVATSLAAGESRPKHCGLLLLHGQSFIMQPERLRSVRPFVFGVYDLGAADLDNGTVGGSARRSGSTTSAAQALIRRMAGLYPGAAETMRLVSARVDEMIEEATKSYDGPAKPPPLPLIRLQVTYTNEYQVFNTIQFGQHYTGLVANPEDMVKLKLLSVRKPRVGGMDPVIGADMDDELAPEDWADNIESVLTSHFEAEDNRNKMKVLNSKTMIEALSHFTRKDDLEAITMAMELEMQETVDKLIERQVLEDDIQEAIANIAKEKNMTEQFKVALEKGSAAHLLNSRIYAEMDNALTDANLGLAKATKAKATASRKTNGKATATASSFLIDLDDYDDDDMDASTTPLRGKGSRGGGRGSRGGGRGSRGPRGGTRASKF